MNQKRRLDERGKVEAPSGFEPLSRSFADCSLSHLGTAPREGRIIDTRREQTQLKGYAGDRTRTKPAVTGSAGREFLGGEWRLRQPPDPHAPTERRMVGAQQEPALHCPLPLFPAPSAPLR